MNTFIGIKQSQTQAFLQDGTRIPVTAITTMPLSVVAHKTQEKAGYIAFQVGLGIAKKPNKAVLGHIRGAKLQKAPRFFREIRLVDSESLPEMGSSVSAADVLKPGDIVDVTAVSKGKGFAGVVKRHHFKGGPRTHGQSDRERAPGSIGQTTTPGRVYKGKRMAGRMGHTQATIKNLKIVDVKEALILIKGLVPGGKNSIITIKKIGEDKKFVPLYKEEVVVESKAEPVNEEVKKKEGE